MILAEESSPATFPIRSQDLHLPFHYWRIHTIALYLYVPNMSETIHFSPPSLRLLLPSSRITTSDLSLSDLSKSSLFCQSLSIPTCKKLSLHTNLLGFQIYRNHVFGVEARGTNVWSGEGSLREVDDSPVSVELEPICSESQFDRVIAEAQQLEESVIVVWMASWCRKCIYLRPKLEKLAADHHPRLRFYHVNVNNVPHKLVARAGVTKMPTIQLWKDGKKQAEVIGGNKAYLVVNEVREMIENESAI